MTLELVGGQTIGSLPHGERRKMPVDRGSTSIEQWVNLIRLAGFDDRPAFLDHAQVYLVLCANVVPWAGIRLN
jgi:hypothetical protein